MATFTGTSNADTADAVGGTITGFTGGTPAELQDSTGDTFDAGGGADSIEAANGADTITGGLGADTLRGGFGGDFYRYLSASEITGDVIDGSNGLDTLWVVFDGTADFSAATILSSGFNSIERLDVESPGPINVIFDGSQFDGNGGLALDLVVRSYTFGHSVTVTFNNIANTGFFNASAITVENGSFDHFVFNAANPVSGTTGAEITGTSRLDIINGGTGRDTINGSLGSDENHGGADNDTFYYTSNAQIGFDTIDGGASSSGNGDALSVAFAGLADFRDATILSTGGNTSIEFLWYRVGGAHEVRFNGSQFGGGGLSTTLAVQGNSGADSLYFDNVSTASFDLSGLGFGSWNDDFDRVFITAVTGLQTITGSNRADSIKGVDATPDTLIGGDGADTLEGGLGNDSMDGGVGNDVFIVDSAFDVITDTGGDLADEVRTTLGTYTLGADFEHLRYIGFGQSNLGGNASDNSITGGANNDVIRGFLGADALDGGEGNDTLIGGAGGDQLLGGNGFDTIDFRAAGGSVTLNLFAGTGTGGDAAGDTYSSIETVIGTGFADTITGSSDHNIIEGGFGADVMDAGLGNDYLSYANATSFVAINLDVVFSSAGGWAGDAAGDRTTGFENLLGSAFDDFLYGDAGANILRGGAGADVLYGGGNSDTIDYSDNAVGVVVDMSTLTASGGNAQGDTLISVENIVATPYADVLIGFSASNSIYGWFGVDTMTGLGGNDIFIFRSIFDSGNAAGQRDTITDFFTVHGDQLDFTGIDADGNAGNGDTAFTFIGTAAFTALGQIRYFYEGGSTVVEINTEGDLNSEMEIILTNGNLALAATDFML